MRIGIDLTPLQGGSRMRGIGYTLINVINNLDDTYKKNNEFVFFLEETGKYDPLELLKLEGVNYQTFTVPTFKRIPDAPSKLRILTKVINNIRGAQYKWIGSQRFKGIPKLDVFFQGDPGAGMPTRRQVKRSVLIIYDLIPYVMESEYLWSYSTCRQRGLSRKASFKRAFKRWAFKTQANIYCKRASRLIAISKWTKDDYHHILGTDTKKIDVVLLGVNDVESKGKDTTPGPFTQEVKTDWGYLPKPVKVGDKPFLLFVGGADPRRRLVDLIAAYNTLRSKGYDLQLVFAGDSMQNIDTVANHEVQQYLKHSGYLDDILLLGFITDEQRDWLFANALAYVFPTVYEGFGLPILEAMKQSCPVITYMNTSITDVAGDAVLKAKNSDDIFSQVKLLLDDTHHKERNRLIKAGHEQANKFNWKRTSDQMFKIITQDN